MRDFDKKPKIKSNSIYFQLGLIAALAVALFFIERTTKQTLPKTEKVTSEVFQIEESYNEKVKIEESKPQQKVVKKIPKQLPKEPNDVEDLNPTEVFKTETPKANEGDLNLSEPNNDEVITYVPDNKKYGIDMLSEVPVFPGCGHYKTREEKVACFSEKIKQMVNRKFDSGLGAELGLQGLQRIYVNFTVNKNGEIVDIIAKSKHEALAKEAKRVTGLLPQMQPGKQNGQAVNVNYSLPIVLDIQ
ncbi:energy transducer TonB [Mesonia sp.]|uniref:energy transducer TonB n=1 Tax=Mesonia sp. TaxID=1960830 RepID=UPI00175523C9|nr:energy transducer TonB [Mesonia sp.]HIB36510.1 hypothetical protein [Mesonia sp.]HIO26652.1 hypothetical protein [Flavobacteriaceae bacterium]